MKCPKCGYLGFETVERCRNCGYDFSFAIAPPVNAELPLHEGKDGGGPLGDFDLATKSSASPGVAQPMADALKGTPLARPLDLDRLIGSAAEETDLPASTRTEQAPSYGEASMEPSQGRTGQPPAKDGEEPPMGSRPRPMGPPLAVRRTTPEIPRGRPHGARPPRREERPLFVESELDERPPEVAVALPARAAPAPIPLGPASRIARIIAAAIDMLLLGGISAVVLYLTLGIAGLTAAEWRLLPPIPMASFLLLLTAGYLTAFTAAGGRTIGKMATRIRVVGDDGLAIDVSGAVLRAIGGLITMLALGLPYLPALLAADGRTLADRLAGTRVVRAD